MTKLTPYILVLLLGLLLGWLVNPTITINLNVTTQTVDPEEVLVPAHQRHHI